MARAAPYVCVQIYISEVIIAVIDLTGMRFGRWTVTGRAEDRIGHTGYKTVMWNCRCDCGNSGVICGKSLRRGDSQSCGCLAKEAVSRRASRHGGFGTRLYNIWDSLRQRCLNPQNAAYHNYGGRGITICPEWDDFSVFREWALNTGYEEDAPRGKYTIDRIDVNGNYSPDNCRWTGMKEQAQNRRNTIMVEYNGETRPLSEWADISGIKYCTLWKRYSRGAPIFK